MFKKVIKITGYGAQGQNTYKIINDNGDRYDLNSINGTKLNLELYHKYH